MVKHRKRECRLGIDDELTLDQSVQTVGCGHDIAIRFLPTLRVYVVIYCIASFHVETVVLMSRVKE